MIYSKNQYYNSTTKQKSPSLAALSLITVDKSTAIFGWMTVLGPSAIFPENAVNSQFFPVTIYETPLAIFSSLNFCFNNIAYVKIASISWSLAPLHSSMPIVFGLSFGFEPYKIAQWSPGTDIKRFWVTLVLFKMATNEDRLPSPLLVQYIKWRLGITWRTSFQKKSNVSSHFMSL